MKTVEARTTSAPVSTEAQDVQVVRFHLPALPDVDGFLADARAIVESGQLSNGPYGRRLEQELSALTDAPEMVGVANASGGLIAALYALVEPGAEVIIPAYTYLATWQAVVWAGMLPVVVDVDERGLLDPGAASAAATAATGAVMAVHMAGQPAAMQELQALAARLGVPLLTDAAHALGATTQQGPVGSLADAEVFSLGATKQVAAGEAGCVAVRDSGAAARVRRFAFQGHEPGSMDAIGPGMNLKLPELSAALALRVLPGLSAQLERRAAIHGRYADAWQALPLRLSGPGPGERCAHKDQLVWLDDAIERDALRAFMARRSIETKLYYAVAVPDLTVFQGRVASADRARDLADRSLAVPIHARLRDDEVDRVIHAVLAYFGQG